MASNSFRKQVLKLRRFTLVVVVCVITISALLFEQTRFSQRAVNENIPLLGTNGGVLANSFSVQLPSTLHYVWCGDKTFRFQHYLGVLSAVRILQPSKILFHSTHLPDTSGDGYHTWFLNLQEALPNLVLRKLSVSTVVFRAYINNTHIRTFRGLVSGEQCHLVLVAAGSLSHDFHALSFSSNSVTGFKTDDKFGRNRPRKFIMPRILLSSVTLVGVNMMRHFSPPEESDDRHHADDEIHPWNRRAWLLDRCCHCHSWYLLHLHRREGFRSNPVAFETLTPREPLVGPPKVEWFRRAKRVVGGKAPLHMRAPSHDRPSSTDTTREVPNTVTSTPCTSEKLFDFVIDNFFSQDGGIFIGESVILTRSPRDLDDVSVVWSASGISSAATNGVMIVKKRIDGNILKRLVERSKRKCTSADEYNSKRSEWDCITVESNLYPRDVWATLTPFAELARWLYYGRRAPFLVPRSQTEVIPRIAHCIWLASDKKMFSQLQLTHFISVLSALYVGGFRHVYVHGDREPGGVLWEDLRTENVTFVKTEKPETVFQTHVNRVPEHISDILRTNILFKYGGAYMDLDVIWTSRVPGWLLSYPTVVSLEWVRQGDWPETFNMGVLMAQQRAPWFKKFVPTLRDYRDSSWGRNAIMMPYRAYERQPDSLYVDRYLQVMNFDGISHPTWQSDYLRDMSDHRLTQPFNWSDVRSLHLTFPEPVPSLTSFKALREGKDVLAEIGRYVLEKSRRTHLLDSGISFR
ncbi:uncharacterized protein [Littorina saxatilis]|uniref:uncharacterized protein n=1 Tax=Littorina saxatilis TaxID=31220 RepID=UPI0038B4797A